jgi:endonuclease
MSIYEKPVRLLIREMISALGQKPGQQFSKNGAIEWFAQHYPKIKEGTIAAHLIRFSTNAPSRLHYSVRADEDLLYQIDGSHFRLYDPASDPAPIRSKSDAPVVQENLIEPSEARTSSEFAYESDLRDFLAKIRHASRRGSSFTKTRGLPVLSSQLAGALSTYLPWTQRSAL